MAKDRKKLLHIHSSIPDKQPTATSIEVGEIAVNNAANQEFLSIKNSNNKIKRFSSDEQIITWMEKKEVMPYEGYTRGSNGPTGSTGPNSVTNNDLLQNKSNLIIKLNQVAATNTVMHDKVNGAKDIYGKCVNPTSDSGVTDGAGFAIDMSRYAMIGANPGFSAATVSAQTNLSGNTYITNGASANTYGTDTGHTLTIKTTDVTANDTNWTETITNRTSTVTNETDKITTLNASATTANVSGNTLVLQEATSISAKTPTAYLSGTTLDVKETNTDITSCGRISANTNDFEVKQCAANGKFIVNSDDADVSGKTLDIIENTSVTVKTPAASVSGATLVADESTSISAKTPTAYLSGTTLDVKETNTDIQSCGRISANTNAFTVQECAAGSGKTVINQTDIDVSGKTFDVVETTSATIKAPATTISGTSLTVDEGTSISAKTPSTTISGTNLTINESNTVISSCTKVDIVTNDLNIKQCTTGTVDFDFCNGFTVNSNNIKLHECSSAGTISISAQTQNINGGNLTINESGNTAINTTGATNIKSTGNTNVETNGANNKVTIQASGTGGDVEVFAKDTLCASGVTAAFNGATTTNVGSNCSGGGNTATLNVRGVTTNISAGTLTETVTGATNETHTGTVTINNGSTKIETTTGAVTENNKSGYTVNTSGDTTIETNGTTNIHSIGDGKAVHINAVGGNNIVEISTTGNKGKIQVNAVGDESAIQMNSDYVLCLSGKTTAAFIGGVKTNIGKNCSDGGPTTILNLNGNTINETGATVNISGSSSTNVSGATVNVSGGSICETASGTAAFVGTTKTNIGANCSDGGNTATLNVRGVTTNISAGTITQTTSGDTTINVNGKLTESVVGTTTENHGGAVTINNASGITFETTGKTCIQSSTDVNIGGDVNTNIGVNCTGGVHSNNVGISAQTAITLNAPSVNITGTVYGLQDLTVQYGTNVSNRTSAETYNGSAAKTIGIPSTLAQISNGVVSDTNAASTTAGQINITKNVSVTGTITASGAIYSSDRNLKENIQFVKRDEFNKVANIFAKSYNFKSDKNKSKTYGVIAQDVQDAGLPELVHITDDKGTLGVDYTSLFILKIAYLEDFCAMLNGRIVGLENRIKELENKE